LNQVTDPDRVLYPLKRAGQRGEGKWVRVSWDEALTDIGGRIRTAIQEGRHNAVMYHLGRPGEDGYTEHVLAAWGVDGHNSHTNICSSSGRAGYHYWMGFDRPSPDHANADVVLLISAHLESGHYFNPHAQRIIEGKGRGAKLIVFDVRLSNTATHADYWVSPYPGSEAAILLAIANHLIQHGLYNRDFVRHWWNWQEYLRAERPHAAPTFENFEAALKDLYKDYTFAFAAQESGVDARVIEEIAYVVSQAGTRLSSHTWRSATAGNLGGWQVSRSLFMLNALLGAVATEGGTYPNAWNKFVPRPMYTPPHPQVWNHLKFFESQQRPGEKLTIDEYYGHIFENSVPGLPERAAAEGLKPLAYMRRYGAFEVQKKIGPLHEQEVPQEELEDLRTDDIGRVFPRGALAPA
jgi:anaerobic selenocysteine-containing dehydrogenase